MVIEPLITGLSRSEARACEQVLIEHYGLNNLLNIRNSIALTNPTYNEAITIGTRILVDAGIL